MTEEQIRQLISKGEALFDNEQYPEAIEKLIGTNPK